MQITELKKKGLEREFKIIVPSKDVAEKLNGSLLEYLRMLKLKVLEKERRL